MADGTIREEALALAKGLEGFQDLVERHLVASGMPQTRYSIEAYGTVDFIRLLRSGRNFRRDTMVRALDFIARPLPHVAPDEQRLTIIEGDR